jgi:hypothetical protein
VRRRRQRAQKPDGNPNPGRQTPIDKPRSTNPDGQTPMDNNRPDTHNTPPPDTPHIADTDKTRHAHRKGDKMKRCKTNGLAASASLKGDSVAEYQGQQE